MKLKKKNDGNFTFILEGVIFERRETHKCSLMLTLMVSWRHFPDHNIGWRQRMEFESAEAVDTCRVEFLL